MTRLVFFAAVFLGAFLVFQIQPLIGKYVLPWYGGAAAVWTTCLLVFQSLLFAGYAYAHLLARAGKRTQAVVHLVLLAAAMTIPILPGETWKPAGDENPLLRIALMLGATIGLPYFALSASGPLLQSWHWRVLPGVSPYPLYALSNAGSLLALLSYPLLFEPFLSGRHQAGLWKAMFVAFAVVSALAALRLWRERESAAPATPSAAGAPAAPSPSLARRAVWVGWSACAVILFMAVTNQLTLNVASVPFLWVLPLSIYLLAFVLAFSGERAYPRVLYGALLVVALVAVTALVELDVRMEAEEAFLLSIQAKIGIYVTALFVLCMVALGELYRARPDPRHLTSFYLAIAFGGALGGILVGALAPLVFLLYQELQLGLLLCCILYVGVRLKDPASPLSLRRGRLAPAAAAVGMLALFAVTSHQADALLEDAVSTRRNFFGLLRIKEFAADDPDSHALRLFDGAILHGYQFVRPDLRREPTTYFTRETGVGRVLRLKQQKSYLKIGIVGLGVGTLAALAREGDSIRFYEINPAVVDVARNEFKYLEDTPAAWDVVVGDARLQLDRESPQGYDFLVLDAFSSDSVPVHLLTLEAFEIYERHLAPRGVIAINISNQHLDLSTVVYRAAAERKFHPLWIRNEFRPEAFTFPAVWMVLSRDAKFMNEVVATLEPLQESGGLVLRNKPNPGQEDFRAWRDDSSSLLRILRRSPARRSGARGAPAED